MKVSSKIYHTAISYCSTNLKHELALVSSDVFNRQSIRTNAKKVYCTLLCLNQQYYVLEINKLLMIHS